MFANGTLVVPKADPRHEARVEKVDGNRVRVRYTDTHYLGYFNLDELIEPRNLPAWLQWRMKMKRRAEFTIKFSVDLDMVPGPGHSPDDWIRLAAKEFLHQRHYDAVAETISIKVNGTELMS